MSLLSRIRLRHSAFLAIVFACAVSLTAPLLAMPATVTVITATELEVMRGTQVSMRVPLAVGADLDVIGIEGDYVLVRYRVTRGRVALKSTDFALKEPIAPTTAVEVPAAPAATPPAARPAAQPSVPPRQPPIERPAATAPKAPVGKVVPLAALATRNDPADELAKKWGPVAMLIFLAVLLAVVLVTVIANWRVYTKAGKPGWAAIVPIYNVVVLNQIAGKPGWWTLLWFVPFVNFFIMILVFFGLAENFGKGKGFALGLIVLPYFFMPILAFGDAQYLGAD